LALRAKKGVLPMGGGQKETRDDTGTTPGNHLSFDTG